MSSRLSVGDWPLATTSPGLDNRNCQAAASIGDSSWGSFEFDKGTGCLAVATTSQSHLVPLLVYLVPSCESSPLQPLLSEPIALQSGRVARYLGEQTSNGLVAVAREGRWKRENQELDGG